MQNYISEIQKYYSDENSSEHSYRTSFENFLKDIFSAEEKYFTQQDQRAINGNKPDFVVLKNGTPVLYIEVKKVGEDLDKIEKSDQADRYFGYDNLIISDYVNFRFYRNGQKYNDEISLGDVDRKSRTIETKIENTENLIKTIKDFTLSHKEAIKSGNHLAKIMGGKAQRIRNNVLDMLTKEDKYAELFKIRDVVQQNLITGLDDEKFADMYAQTLVYGLFAARYSDSTLENFSRVEARELVPKTNPFLASFFDHIAGSSFPKNLSFIVDELCEVFTHADVTKLLHDFYGKEKDNKDPVIHFYEDFLREYDSKKKMEMGVFYTPRPVVQFIVRAVDEVLKNEFGLVKGLADTSKIIKKEKVLDPKSKTGKEMTLEKEYHRVQILDVATGTGTFLNEVIMDVYKSFEGQEGRWKSYVESDLLPRLHGFELMMASYTIAHLKLGMTLHDTGAIGIDKRLGVYLTNTLEEARDTNRQMNIFAQLGLQDAISNESISASEIKKDYPIMCVIGNPPYSGISQNKDYTDNNVYKVEIGGKEKLKEKKNWLDDDYVKFIRFGESLIEKNNDGVLAMITAHGYIDNPTFRGMRWHLRNTFDKIYVVDLHGNSRKKETAEDGGKDENVFDIMSGVSIVIGIKNKVPEKTKKLAQVFVSDLWGTRKSKLESLDGASIENIKWIELPPGCDIWRLEGEGRAEYQKGFSVAELFPKNTTGIVTMGDSFIIDENKEVLKNRVDDFLYNNPTENEIKTKYELGKNYAKWIIDNKKKIINDDSKIVPVAYRPFDTRYTYFDNNLVWRPRSDVMQHFFNRENVGLVFKRGDIEENSASVFISKNIIDFRSWSRPGMQGGDFIAPFYIYTENGEKISNLNNDILKDVEKVIGSTTAENIFDYVYGYLHDKKYREKYNEFLKIDFPRVPYPANKAEFDKYVDMGNKLRMLHLMDAKTLESIETKITFPESGSDILEDKYPKYVDRKVYINENQYFGNVSKEAWEFYIGGYQPAQKWLKDRRGRKLSNNDIEHYQNIVKALEETYKIMNS
jgi:predicted helicase